jgi:hypothetical protein
MRVLHTAPAQLQKAFPRRICVRYSEQKGCHHKIHRLPWRLMNRMVRSMHPEVVKNNLVHPHNIIYHDILSVKSVTHPQEIVRFAGGFSS